MNFLVPPRCVRPDAEANLSLPCLVFACLLSPLWWHLLLHNLPHLDDIGTHAISLILTKSKGRRRLLVYPPIAISLCKFLRGSTIVQARQGCHLCNLLRYVLDTFLVPREHSRRLRALPPREIAGFRWRSIPTANNGGEVTHANLCRPPPDYSYK
jgi:hypothetical protein